MQDIKTMLADYDPAKAPAETAGTAAAAAQPAQKPAAPQKPFNDKNDIVDAIEKDKISVDELTARLQATQSTGSGDAKDMAKELIGDLGRPALGALIAEDRSAISRLFNTFQAAGERKIVMGGLQGKSGSDAKDILDAVVAAKTRGKAAGMNMITDTDTKAAAEKIIDTLKIN